MQRRSSKAAKGGKKLPTAYSKADAFGGSKYEVSHIVGKGAYGVVWCDPATCLTAPRGESFGGGRPDVGVG